MTTAAEPRPAVSRFEQRLIFIARSLLGFGAADGLATWLSSRCEASPCLSPLAARLLEETLAKGVVRQLAEQGCRHERFFTDGKTTAGNLWNRVPAARRQLHFSRHVLAWLRWAVEHNVVDPPAMPDVVEPALTVADRLFFALAARRLSRLGDGLFGTVARQPAFCRNAVVWLEHHQALARCRVMGKPDWERWFAPGTQWVLEAWQHPLAEAWVASTLACAGESDIDDLRRASEVIERVAAGFCEAATLAGRRDLCRFWLTAARQVAARGGYDFARWFPGLSMAALPMAERQRHYRMGLAVPRILVEHLAGFQREARAIGYLDEGYEASQLFKSEWEAREGDRLVGQANELLKRFLLPISSET